jgi:uncharacterized protein DUF1176
MRWILTLLSLGFATPAFADVEAFRDWRAECTDENICVLVNRATGPAGEDVVLALRRRPEADAPWQISVTPLDPPVDLTHPFAMNVDGGPKLTFNPGYDFLTYGAPSNLFLVNAGLAERLLGGMAGGNKAGVFYEPDGGGKASASFALPGLADGLAWIDEAQARTDLSRRVAPPVDLEPHESMAGLSSAIDGGSGQRGLPNNVLAQHYGVHGCEDLDSPLMAKTEPFSARLSDSAVLYAVPCTASGGAVASRLYIVETGEIGGIEALSFARYSAAYGWTGSDTLINVSLDADTGELSSVSAGRDVDGCGHAARWRWRDIRLALIEYHYRETCGGSDDPARWPVVFALTE